jgi:hypothetical protein
VFFVGNVFSLYQRKAHMNPQVICSDRRYSNYDIALSRNGRVALSRQNLVNSGWSIHVLDLDCRPIAHVDVPGGMPRSFDISSDGQSLMTVVLKERARAGDFLFWAAERLQDEVVYSLRRSYRLKSDGLTGLAKSSPCNKYCVFSDGIAVYEYEVAKNETRQVWTNAEAGPVFALSGDGSRIAFGGNDERRLSLWNYRTKTRIWSWQGSMSPVSDIALSVNGKLMAVGHRDNTILLWRLAE